MGGIPIELDWSAIDYSFSFFTVEVHRPGAVVISGPADQDRMGRTALAGPVVNVVITTVLLR